MKFEDSTLPPQACFFSQLTQEGITDEDYNHAKNVWETFSIQNMGEYHDLYVLSDTCLLADVFESFHKLCMESDGMDPYHLYAAPFLFCQYNFFTFII